MLFMTIEIKHKITGKVLKTIEAETLSGADLIAVRDGSDYIRSRSYQQA